MVVFHMPDVFVVPLRGEISPVRLVVGQLHEDKEDEGVEENGIAEHAQPSKSEKREETAG